ncbi:hypothetical protein TGS27_2975 [Geobacillus stearothermophilus]|uniref:Uncharacterized protein n=1 Tax=Geobacillus stearothermophilus TaxID=1422 RepID=A0ABQ7HDW1_GEOSE|nr:hypothetical protein GS8_2560 [Geobacillus stearothermophilus]OAO76762.1 hypothetical protein TGS27_2975 [Geobacillus stearothermophilus]
MHVGANVLLRFYYSLLPRNLSVKKTDGCSRPCCSLRMHFQFFFSNALPE